MTTTMPATDFLDAMVQTGARAVAATVGAEVAASQLLPIPVDTALATAGTVVKRSQLSDGQRNADLITILPSSGMVTAQGSLDAAQLAEALVQGAVAGIGQAGGPALQAAAPEHVAAGGGVELAGAQAFGFDLTVAERSVTVIWVVEATLGPILGGSIPVDGPSGGPSVAPAALPELGRTSVVGDNRDIRILSDVVTNVTVEIARGSVRVRDLTAMAAGTVFELDREAGDPVDILVNGSIVARGDIVVVGNQLGIEITEIVEPRA